MRSETADARLSYQHSRGAPPKKRTVSVGPDKVLELLGAGELDIEHPGKGHHHGKTVDLHPVAKDVPKLAPSTCATSPGPNSRRKKASRG